MNDRPPEAMRPIGSVILDLDGVVYLGSTPIPGSAGIVRDLQEDGWQVLFATNNSTKTPESIAEVLRVRAELLIDPGTVITSGMAAADHLSNSGVSIVSVVGSTELEATLRRAGFTIVDHQSAEAVVVGLDRNLTDETVLAAASAIRAGALFVATNTDITFPTPDGPVPGAGQTVAAVAAASDSRFVACGKPHDPMIRLVSRMLTTDQVWMVGDRPETDIAFAQRAGWRSVLTLTGVTTSSADVPEELMPDDVVGSLSDLRSVLPSREYITSSEG